MFGRLLGRKKTYEEEFAANLYKALVLDGGPSSAAEDRKDAASLGVRLGDLERFERKRLITLEAMLFVATQIATTSSEGDDNVPFPLPHTLGIEVAKVIQSKWSERGIVVDTSQVGERCFDEIQLFLDKPFKWGREWLDEFFDEGESGERYIMWTDQCLKEFQVMQQVIKQHL
jgi:hypothetical protein